VIGEVLDLRMDGNEQPQFFALTLRYLNMGDGYARTTVFGTQAYLRQVLADGGIPAATVDALFQNAHH
jgi:hypothetical protein